MTLSKTMTKTTTVTRTTKRSAKKHRYVGVWVPEDLAETMEQAVRATDSDTSKFMRGAMRTHLNRLGFKEPARTA